MLLTKPASLVGQTGEAFLFLLVSLIEKGKQRYKQTAVPAERKSLYSNIENLRIFGLDICGYQMDRTFYYQLVNRDFQLPELKLLVDAVQASRFITEKESKKLIK